MAPPARRISTSSWERTKAILSMAGLRQLVQANISVNAAAEGTYTVQNEATRRVVVVHTGTAVGDIRFNINATATATNFPILPAKYTVIDVQSARPVNPGEAAKPADVLHFFNTSAGAITVLFMEVD